MKLRRSYQPICLSKYSNKALTVSKQKWLTTARYSLLVGAAVIALSGCQSTDKLSHSSTGTNALIDFSIANPTQSQGSDFRAHLNANAERYEQLFDTNKNPNSEQQAKLHLLNAIRQHMASEHVAVAQARYNLAPFIDPDSIDNGSSSLLRTLLEIYAYRESTLDEDSYEAYDEAVEADDASVADCYDKSERLYENNSATDEAMSANCTDDSGESVYDAARDAIEAVDSDEKVPSEFKVAYSQEGYDYDEEGYDRDGYDENGYDRGGYDYDGYDENGYDENGFDYEGRDYYGYDKNGETESDYEAESTNNSIRERIANNNPRALIADYEAMQAARAAKAQNENTSEAVPKQFSGAIAQLLNMVYKTPEQVQAANAYQYKYLTFNSVSQYQPKERQFKSIYSYDFAAPTISASIQIPLAFDFNNSRVSIDPTAIMPIVALVNPEHTPLPEQMSTKTVNFGLPEIITSQLPAAVIYDAAINAMQNSLGELGAENFSAIDITGDSFAEQVGATRAIKINFGSKQSGEIVGKMLKYMSQSLQQYVDANPSKYPDGAVLKSAIGKLQLYNKGYQSTDVGALLQLIEAIAPFSFNQSNYYYLNNADQLLAKQQRIHIDSDLIGSKTTVLNQIRYDRGSFNNSRLTPLLAQAFGANAKPAIDGDAWLAQQREQNERLEQARSARYSYDYDGSYDESTTEDERTISFESDSDSYTDD